MNVRSSRPAPASSTNASAISATTSVLRSAAALDHLRTATRRDDRRRQAERDPDRQADRDQECDDAPVEADLLGARDLHRRQAEY
ncbi:MAG: hypothetical protein ACRD2X_10185 [Vicinamibacteraceae bacterium]